MPIRNYYYSGDEPHLRKLPGTEESEREFGDSLPEQQLTEEESLKLVFDPDYIIFTTESGFS